MKATTKRDAVLVEFAENDEYRVLNPDAMADEIVLLRERLATVEVERDTLRLWKEENQHAIISVVVSLVSEGVVSNGAKSLNDAVEGVIKTLNDTRSRADHAERVLAKLKKPSEAVWRAALGEYNDGLYATHPRAMRLAAAIRAAFDAAEREVDV